MSSSISPFLELGPRTKANSLAVLHLSRDNLMPVYLQQTSGEHDGYSEGVVVNTRYGSFPHSTMLNVPWGSQIRASKVDTGSRGRKRKRVPGDEADRDNESGADTTTTNPAAAALNANGVKEAVAASSGFIHVLPPTPEIWTTSLPHRTQVVYTPDYSYILHRIRARPGAVVIEAGAGSGSFSHASARAVYNGYPQPDDADKKKKRGRVISFEYHEQRFHKMKQELADHCLDQIVHLTHRDVYKDGFLIEGSRSPEAEAVFLDLPAPWEALPHLSRRKPEGYTGLSEAAGQRKEGEGEWTSPLNPRKSVYICSFSPCIEQVTKTVSAMRRLGWVDIDMVEIANRKYHTVRDRVGLNMPVDRGVNNSARDDGIDGEGVGGGKKGGAVETSAHPWMDGRLVTRGEPEIKTHTSYLVFAILPREWTKEDEEATAKKYPIGEEKQVVGNLDKAARKKERQEQMKKLGNRKTRRKERDEKMAETEG
ncbi:S-adenosyl-L-methionine-dependent methyltransferase [Bombardia bombarda]|uniref:tRNA (adenine(58)-N(1))-methyltransferase catalytic subunit TRM61 n=1 Tax=Bombardia bombarda TaxID=252184 RepID=A0AA40BW47_9PEZI|nr:S-adenosyl-L-methionine-dependent methyltransferase [Bombardia bombarda]